MPIIRTLFPPELKQFLQLTDSQVGTINQLNLDYSAYYVRRQMRIAQVEREIQELTNAEPLDPAGLGIRYAEVEAIRRDLREQEVLYRNKTVAVLNDVQKARLRLLDEAWKLQPRIREAQCVNLLPDGQVPGVAVRDPYPVANFVVGAITAEPILFCAPRMFQAVVSPQP